MDKQDRSIEAMGEDVQAAIAAGLKQLSVAQDAVEVEVLREGSRGVLGIGARDAIVRLTLREPEEEAVVPAVVVAEEALEPVDSDNGSEPEPDPRQSQQETLDLARDILAELLEKMQIEAEIETNIIEPRFAGDTVSLVLDLHGDDLGYLIGRKGETLAAIQHLTRLMVNKAVQRRSHIVVDVEGYKARRESALKKLALRIADQATRRGRRIALEPMPAYERRIIHITLRNHPTVITESVGDRDQRKVTILPKP